MLNINSYSQQQNGHVHLFCFSVHLSHVSLAKSIHLSSFNLYFYFFKYLFSFPQQLFCSMLKMGQLALSMHCLILVFVKQSE